MNLPRTLAWRYLRRPKDRFVSIGGFLSILGLVIGVMALVISMGLMTGYKQDLERKILAGSSEIIVSSRGVDLDGPAQYSERLEKLDWVERRTEALFTQGLASTRKNVNGHHVTIKGVPVALDATPHLERILGDAGSRGARRVAIGTSLAERLDLEVDDSLRLTVPVRDSGSVLPRGRELLVGNIYETGFFELDDSWVFVEISALRELIGETGGFSVLEIDVADDYPVDEAAEEITSLLGPGAAVTDLRGANRALFRQLDFLRFILFLVIGMIVFVSTFNIVSMLIMTIEEKGREVALLIAMGARRSFVRSTFVWFGTLVGVAGTLLGLGLGVLASWILTRWELVSFGPEIAEVYLVTHIPFVNDAAHLLVIGAFAIAVSWLASWLTSVRAARITPATALRHA